MKTYRTGLVCTLALILTWVLDYNPAVAQQDGDDISIGTYRVLHSDLLDEDRLLFVYVPQEYDETELGYPVLYLLWVDIHNYFADAVTVTEKLAGGGEIPPVIIVGVANTDRYRDLLPVPSRDSGQGGGADNFIRFFETELIPHIDNTYRTKDFRILAGPQAAAIFTLYTLTTRPGLFQAYITGNPFMNPSNTEFLYPRAEAFLRETRELKSFLYIGCEKSERPEYLAHAEAFAAFLEAEKPEHFRFTVEIGEPSGYFIPPLPFRDGLRALFQGHKLPEDFETNTVTDVTGYYERLSKEFGFEVDPPELTLAFEGNKLSRQGKFDEAVGVFEHVLSLYPKSLNALWQLGETSRRTGEFEKARDYYRRFLAIRSVDVSLVRTRFEQMEKIIAGSAAYRIGQAIRRGGIEAGLATYRDIRADDGSTLYFDEGELNALGYRLMGSGNPPHALEIFRLIVELYPESANAYDSLAEAYMNVGDNENAVANYRRSLELNPDNTNAAEKLKELQ